MDKSQEKALVCDAKEDILRILNMVTDEHMPCPDATHKFSVAYEKLFSVEQDMTEAGVEASHAMDGPSQNHTANGHAEIHDDWGNADPQAKALFESLAKHYKGFWKYGAAYKASPTEQNKQAMLMHFEEQLKAHDAMAAFVMGRCEILCPEIKQILATWKASKQG